MPEGIYDTTGGLHLVVFLDCGDVTKQHGADFVLFEVLGHTVDGLAVGTHELEELARHGVLEAVDARLAPIGGYICGTAACIEQCAYRLSAPGLGQEVGASLGVLPSFYQGFFLAPTVAAGALKGAVFAANVFEKLGYDVIPNGTEPRYDIIQAVTLKKPEALIAFCQGIQAAAPVDSYVTPEPWDMPGYDSQVIMAAGAFIQGSSIELSADGPLKEPYAVYFQGGLTWYHAKYGIMMALEKLVQAGIVTL